MSIPNYTSFIKLSKFTLILVYLVILAGAVVRATGSGMGCPDWPKCFGSWVPPVNESDLPENYQEIYKDRGYADTTFNVYHTWTEYVNRLMGALLGVFIFLVFLSSLKLRKDRPALFLLSLLQFFLVGFQGWLGAKVVSSNLAPVKITIHMLVALLILAVMIRILQLARGEKLEVHGSSKFRFHILAFILLLIIQTVFGTQVRESVDHISALMGGQGRDVWVDHINWIYPVHRSFSILVLAYSFWIFRMLEKYPGLKQMGKNILMLVLAEVVVGIVLGYFGLPAIAQPVHLLIATFIFGNAAAAYFSLSEPKASR